MKTNWVRNNQHCGLVEKDFVATSQNINLEVIRSTRSGIDLVKNQFIFKIMKLKMLFLFN